MKTGERHHNDGNTGISLSKRATHMGFQWGLISPIGVEPSHDDDHDDHDDHDVDDDEDDENGEEEDEDEDEDDENDEEEDEDEDEEDDDDDNGEVLNGDERGSSCQHASFPASRSSV
jgi:cobalamin biosynthesis protein CobT